MRMIVKVIKEPPRGDAGEVLTAGAADEALYHHTQELKSHRGVCAHRLRELEKRNQKRAGMLQKTKALLQIPML